jgi:hypothetical protein
MDAEHEREVHGHAKGLGKCSDLGCTIRVPVAVFSQKRKT